MNVLLLIIVVIILVIILLTVAYCYFCSSTDGILYPYVYLSRNNNNISNEDKRKILYDIMDVYLTYMEEIDTFPVYGTLLGFYREDRIICYDYDIDFGIQEKDWSKMLGILKKICRENTEYGYIHYDMFGMKFCQLYHRETMLNCDISVYYTSDGKAKRKLFYNDYTFNYNYLFPLQDKKIKHFYKNKEYKIKYPVNPQGILETFYGKFYMFPDHKCDNNCENCVKI